MRLFSQLFLGFLLLGSTLRAEFLIEPKDIIAVCGDSITEQRFYSVFIEDYLLMCQPTPGQKIVEIGWSGERVPGLLARLNSDLLPFKPTVVTTCYGMNDGGYSPINQTISDTYRKAETDTVAALKQNGVRTIIVGSPGCVDTFSFKRTTTAAAYNETLRALGEVSRDVAKQAGVGYADVHGAMIDAMTKAKAANGDSYLFAGPDGVHPRPNGHLVMAYAFLKALGADGAIGTLTLDLAAEKAEGTPGQKIVSFQNNTVEVESTRYPFCFTGDPKDPEATTGIIQFFPFNQDLNRYLLIVKGLKEPGAEVTWGETTKTFSAADLAKGVNLAAEFLANPFSAPFAKVDAAVRAQQNFETLFVKNLLHNLIPFQNAIPKEKESFSHIAVSGVDQDETLFQSAAALVVPVRHTIKITPTSKSLSLN